MTREVRFPASPIAEDLEVGDDSDLPGLDQPLTIDDIDAILGSARGTVAQRRELLSRAREDLLQRAAMDETGEFADLAARVDDALAALGQAGEVVGPPGAIAHDASERAMQPDEILEREEAAREED
jgi:hypothetical protein